MSFSALPLTEPRREPAAEAASIAGRTGAATLLVDGAGHYPHVEAPDPVPARGAALIGGTEPRALQGRRVIVRGWIEQRRGPVIVIDSKGQLELAEE